MILIASLLLTQPMDPEKKSLNFIFTTRYVIPKRLKFSHWPSKSRWLIGCFLWVPSERKYLSSQPHEGFDHEIAAATKPLGDIPLNPGWLIGILILVYEIIPKKLGSLSSSIKTNQPG